MPTKMTAERLAWVKQKHDEGLSDREIARMSRVMNPSGGISANTVTKWLEVAEKQAAETPAGQQAQPSMTLGPLDESPIDPDGLTGMLSGLVRQQRELAEKLMKRGDHIGAQRAIRLAATLATLVQKQQARDEQDGDTVRVRHNDIAAAAERARSKLQDLVARLAAERTR